MLNWSVLLFLGGLIVLALAAFMATRAYTIDQAPKRVMAMIEARIVAGSGGWNACFHNRAYGPRTSAARRANPDSIITSMAYDLTNGPVQVSGNVWPDYWSLSLYQQNSDNFFVINDQQLDGDRFNYVIRLEGQDAGDETATEIISPTRKGIMLIRRFVKQSEDMPDVLQNQDAMTCEQASTNS
ncbi:MAG: DUF1254 domain-containing protein [Pseudomonadota bacterium]